MLKQRLLSGVAMVAAVLLAAYFMPGLGILAILLIVVTLAMNEFYALLTHAGIPSFRVVGASIALALIAATWTALEPGPTGAARAARWEQVVLAASLLAVFVRQFPQKHNAQPLATLGCTLLGVWYVAYLFNFFTWLLFAWEPTGAWRPIGDTGRLLVFYLVAVVKMSDTGAYLVGSRLGRHKLIPRISPGKSWEGLGGGFLFGILTSLAFQALVGGRVGVLTMGVGDAVALGAALSAIGVVGDLFESLLKRAAGIKDASAVLPGMGGVLDVLDSLLLTAPVLYVCAEWFLR
jgi:phosphatidate cytidylyltransferase